MASYRSTEQNSALPVVGIAIGAILGFVRGYGAHHMSGAIYYAVAYAVGGFILGALTLVILRLGLLGVFLIALAGAAALFLASSGSLVLPFRV